MASEVRVQHALSPTESVLAWGLYRQAMQPLAARAAQRHMLTAAEFEEIVGDPRIEKHIAYSDGALIGIGTSTSVLEAWPLISPDYYRARFPGRVIWYIGFVVIAPRSMGVLGPMIQSVSAKARLTGGVAAADYCTFNLERLKIADRIDAQLRHLDPTAKLADTDVQQFNAWTFDGTWTPESQALDA